MRHDSSLSLYLGAVCLLFFFTLTVYVYPITLHKYTAQRALTHKKHSDGYNILTLGGSTTWGATIPDRIINSYPSILGKRPNRVKNAAIRATGAGYPSYCVETIVGEENEQYDIILLEYSLNGIEGLELLIKRLRNRYPDAIIIYVHLYSLQNEVVDEQGRTPFIINDYKERGRQTYRWGGGERTSFIAQERIHSIVSRYNGHMYALPRTWQPMNSKTLFAPDWHHLSVAGHRKVADDLLQLIEKIGVSYSKSTAQVGSWGQGDQCMTWFMDGDCTVNYKGPELTIFQGFGGNMKYSLQFKSTGTITFNNAKSHSVPLYLSYMTKYHSYPSAEVKAGGHKTIIDPTTDSPRHVMKTKPIGWAKPGRNTIEITPMGTWHLPFRVTGIINCGACIEYSEDIELLNSMKIDEKDFVNK